MLEWRWSKFPRNFRSRSRRRQEDMRMEVFCQLCQRRTIKLQKKSRKLRSKLSRVRHLRWIRVKDRMQQYSLMKKATNYLSRLELPSKKT